MTNDEHYEGLVRILTEAINDYVRHHSGGVRIEVLRDALGTLFEAADAAAEQVLVPGAPPRSRMS